MCELDGRQNCIIGIRTMSQIPIAETYEAAEAETKVKPNSDSQARRSPVVGSAT